MEFEIDTERDALGMFGRTFPRRNSNRPVLARRQTRPLRFHYAGEQLAELIPESEELA